MPEGDTIFKTARTLRRVLNGRLVRGVRTPVPELRRRGPALVGRRIAGVDSHGKNLLIRFDDGTVLHTHMRMSGSWHVYRPGETWRKPERRARLVLETDEAVAVCFSAPVVELLTELQARRRTGLERLGPDILAPEPDPDGILRRLRTRGDLAVGEAILSQHLLAGIGNVYKSEALFLCGVSPFVLVRDLGDDDLRRIVETARELMKRNLDGYPRRTRAASSGSRYWVYGRRGAPCFRCGKVIAMKRQGAAARSTYYCPSCQTTGGRGVAG